MARIHQLASTASNRLRHPSRALGEFGSSVGEQVVWLVLKTGYKRLGARPSICIGLLLLLFASTGLLFSVELFEAPFYGPYLTLRGWYVPHALALLTGALASLLCLILAVLLALGEVRSWRGEEQVDSHRHRRSSSFQALAEISDPREQSAETAAE